MTSVSILSPTVTALPLEDQVTVFAMVAIGAAAFVPSPSYTTGMQASCHCCPSGVTTLVVRKGLCTSLDSQPRLLYEQKSPQVIEVYAIAT